MSLDKLKKQLKQDLKKQETKQKNRTAQAIIVLTMLLLTAGGVYWYLGQQSAAPFRLLAQAVEYEVQQQLAEASQTYQQIVSEYPQTPQAAEALYRDAKLWQYDRRDERRALLNYLQLEHDYPNSHLLQPAREEAARITKYSLRDYSHAIVMYQQLVQAESPASPRYLYEISDCYFHLENFAQARIELENLIERYPEDELIVDALYRKGNLLLLEKRYQAAKEDWQRLIEKYPQSRYRVQAEYSLANLLEEQGQLQKALEKYQGLTNFPRPQQLKNKIDRLKKRIAAKKKVE